MFRSLSSSFDSHARPSSIHSNRSIFDQSISQGKMSIRQGSRTFVDALSHKPSSAYVCRQCRQSLKLQQNTLQARNASTVGPNSRRSKRVREWRKPVVYPLYRETQLGEKITEIETPSKDQFDEEGNSVFARDWSGLKVIPSYKDIKDIPNRKEDVYMP